MSFIQRRTLKEHRMRRHRVFPVATLAVVGFLVLSGCSGDGARSLGPVPTAPATSTTTTPPAPSTIAPASTSTTAATVTTVRASTTTTTGPRLVDGIPQVTATPA